ncbi:MAG TPA: DNA internalization-related competence protein ComEC/Rec2 [Bacteroidota bacterium]|nr:DNA internalization-related competence protein ComEC/Rec2 [Bacteroidota bacterium]
MFTHRPAFRFAVFLIIGIVAGSVWGIPLVAALPALAAVLACYAFVKRPALSHALLAAAVILLGAAKLAHDDGVLPPDSITLFTKPDQSVGLTAKVTDLPVVRGESVRFVVDAESIRVYGKSYPASGGVVVSANVKRLPRALADSLEYGRTVTMEGELTEPELIRNPGEFDYKRYLSLNGVYARFRVTHIDSTAFLGEAGSDVPAKFVYPVRASVSNRVRLLFKGETASFLNGLLIGERSDISPDLKTAFVNAGLMHILAVSGLHVAIVVLILMVLLQTLRIPELPRTLLIILLLFYYNFLTGSAASVTRSVVMAIVFLGGKLFEQKSDMYNTLAFSAIVILLFDARQLFQAGFQLSFVAVLSLVYLYPKIHSLCECLPSRLRKHKVLSLIMDGLNVSLAAGIGTLPFTSYYFGKISIVSFVANVVIVPLSNVILALGMLTVAISYCWSWLAAVYAEATAMLTWLMLQGVIWFGNVPWAFVNARLSMPDSILFYVFVGLISNLQNIVCRKLLVAGLLLWLNGVVLVHLLSRTQQVRVTAIDVGQGDALLIELPRKTFLIDGGPRTAALDAGTRFVIPYLRFRGIRKLDGIILSHPHSDHLGGIPAILRSVNVDTIYEAGSAAKGALFREYERAADSAGIPRRKVASGNVIEFGSNARAYVLHPSASFLDRNTENLNNQSVVVKIVYGSTAVLFSGDAEAEAEDRMTHVFGTFLHAALLKAGHHGSKTSSTDDYLRAIGPREVCISVGVRNKFKHPSPLVIERYRQLGVNISRSDMSGAVIFESDGSQWRKIAWRTP